MAERSDSKDIALNYLKEQIVTCAMPPGAPLRINEIAEELGISITPVREAILELQYDHYVEIIPRKSTVVSRISLQDLKDIYDARTFVEPHILTSLNGDCLESNRDTLELLKKQWLSIDIKDNSRETYLAFLKADSSFHLTLINLYSNPHLVKFCRELIYKSQRFWYMALFNNDMEVVRREHLGILDSLLSGNSGAASTMLQKHISVSKALSILSE